MNNGNSKDSNQNKRAAKQPPAEPNGKTIMTAIKDPSEAVGDLPHALLDFSHFEQHEESEGSNVAERHKHRGFFLADRLLEHALHNYTTFRTPEPGIAKAAAQFGLHGAYRLSDAAIEVLEEGVDGLTPQQITDRIIAGIIERIEECAPPELDDIVQEYLLGMGAPQQYETGSSPTS